MPENKYFAKPTNRFISHKKNLSHLASNRKKTFKVQNADLVFSQINSMMQSDNDDSDDSLIEKKFVSMVVCNQKTTELSKMFGANLDQKLNIDLKYIQPEVTKVYRVKPKITRRQRAETAILVKRDKKNNNPRLILCQSKRSEALPAPLGGTLINPKSITFLNKPQTEHKQYRSKRMLKNKSALNQTFGDR